MSVERQKEVSVEFVTWKIVPKLEEVLEQSSGKRQVCYFVFSVHFAVRLFSNRSKKTLNEVRTNTEVVYWLTACVSATTVFLRIIAGAITSFFAPKGGDYSREAIISNTAH